MNTLKAERDSATSLFFPVRHILRRGSVIRTATPNLLNILALISNFNGNDAHLNRAVEPFKLPKTPVVA